MERYAALSERAGAGPSELSARSGETDIPDMVWLRRPARTDATILISVTGDALDGLREILSANVWQTDRPPLHIHVIDPTSTKAPLAFADDFDAALTVENRANSPLKDLDPSGYASAIALCRADTLLEEKTYSRVIIANPALEWFPRLRQLLGARLPGDAAVMDHPWRSQKIVSIATSWSSGPSPLQERGWAARRTMSPIRSKRLCRYRLLPKPSSPHGSTWLCKAQRRRSRRSCR